MMNDLKTITENAEAELTEKKSKFIAKLFYVENEAEIESILKKVKKEYFDAKHHCFAYRIMKDNNIINRCNDDR